ncbi:hypothetical protein K458DRAFT_61621 [Lentithecium fluviatile CBS 122367]|uniref:Uncharacterized protein n=1 Tax=Lentithecium fluviatile CBS 122367 TaxID=1168545 RepID=A0A6G1JJF2_9PLEO|nr:hypothetical protein K458DRAFT_61621 [Lentithecium fluviatile CBS 122367]
MLFISSKPTERNAAIPNLTLTLKKKVVLLKRRVLYPLRKNTLEDVQKQLDRLLENLQIIIQALQLDTATHFHDQTLIKTGAINDEITLVRRRQIYQTELLEHVDEAVETHSTRFSHHASRIETVVHGQTLRMGDIAEQINQLCMSVDRIGQAINHTQHLPPPKMLKDSCDAYKETFQAVQGAPNAPRNSQLFPTKHSLSHLVCSCPENARRRLPTSSQRWFSTFRVDESKHRPGCPFALPSQRTVILGVRMRACLGALRYLVEANLEWSNRSLSPRLLSRNIVSTTQNPGFQLIATFFDLEFRGSPELFPSAIITTMESLMTLFQEKRISAHDVNEIGDSVFHAFFLAIGVWFEQRMVGPNCFAPYISHIQTACRFFCDNNFDMNEKNWYERTPLDSSLGRVWSTILTRPSDSLNILVEVPIVREMEYSLTPQENAFYTFGNYSDIYNKDRFREGCENSALAKAVFRRSQPELQQCLERPDRAIAEAEAPIILHLAVDWPFGLQILLHHGFAGCSHPALDGYSPLDWAILRKNPDSVEMLSHYSAFLTQWTWWLALCSENQKIIGAIVVALFHGSRCSQEKPSSSGATSVADYCTPYHQREVTAEAAQALFNAGFKDVDFNSPTQGTPLWCHASRFAAFSDGLVLRWFTERGARVDHIHPKWNTMPLQLVAERFVVRLIYDDVNNWRYRQQNIWHTNSTRDKLNVSQTLASHSPSEVDGHNSDELGENEDGSYVLDLDIMESFRVVLRVVFQNRSTDQCTCRCAVNGCSAVSSSLKVVRSMVCKEPMEVVQHQKRALYEILTNILESTHHSKICVPALRTMTFDALRLTHTCHDHGHAPDYFGYDPELPLTGTEIQDVQHVEGKDLDFLEDLLEEFEDAWDAWNGKFLQFLDDYWSVCMEEILVEREAPMTDEVKVLEDIGVIVRQYGPELPFRDEERPKLNAWERFERQVEAIMKGEAFDGELRHRYHY